MRRALLVINRNAGAHARNWEARALHELNRHFEVECLRPDGRAETVAAIKQRFEPDQTVIIAGGDGTINAALSAGVRGPLGLLPLGTANDMACYLGLPMDPVRAAQRIAHGHVTHLDELQVNGIPFCTSGGLGFGVDVVQAVESWRQHRARLTTSFGSNIYLAVALWQLRSKLQTFALRLQFQTADASQTVAIDGGNAVCSSIHSPQTSATPIEQLNESVISASLLVSNIGVLARHLKPDPDSNAADGVFELNLVAAQGAGAMLRALFEMCFSRVTSNQRVTSLIVETEAPRTFFGDGELLTHGTRFEITLVPRALSFIV